tara:strand:- start:34158 stop:34403 length:246 start_codon:yes stop_codon:yes gene_type:complete
MDAIQKAERAKIILADTLVVDAFSEMEEDIMDLWKNESSTDLREELWYTLKGLERFKTKFAATISDGEYELAMQEQNHGES